MPHTFLPTLKTMNNHQGYLKSQSSSLLFGCLIALQLVSQALGTTPTNPSPIVSSPSKTPSHDHNKTLSIAVTIVALPALIAIVAACVYFFSNKKCQRPKRRDYDDISDSSYDSDTTQQSGMPFI